jgi:hypothetical protein
VLDDVRNRFGPSALTRATLLHRGRGLRPSLAADEGSVAYAVASRLRRT